MNAASADREGGAEPRWLTDREQDVWRSYRHATTLLEDHLDRQLQRDAGMPHIYYGLLVQLSQAPRRRMRMTQLAKDAKITRSRLSHAIARLEKNGWVRREDCPSDKRGQNAYLTDEGYEVLKRSAPRSRRRRPTGPLRPAHPRADRAARRDHARDGRRAPAARRQHGPALAPLTPSRSAVTAAGAAHGRPHPALGGGSSASMGRHGLTGGRSARRKGGAGREGGRHRPAGGRGGPRGRPYRPVGQGRSVCGNGGRTTRWGLGLLAAGGALPLNGPTRPSLGAAVPLAAPCASFPTSGPTAPGRPGPSAAGAAVPFPGRRGSPGLPRFPRSGHLARARTPPGTG